MKKTKGPIAHSPINEHRWVQKGRDNESSLPKNRNIAGSPVKNWKLKDVGRKNQ